MDGLASEEIIEEVAQKRIKQNQIEMKIGLNWVNKIGILSFYLASQLRLSIRIQHGSMII
jgi:hypothetical protein